MSTVQLANKPLVDKTSSSLPDISLTKEDWFTIVLAVLVSRIVLYFIGLVGVDVFKTVDTSELTAWQTICRFDCVWFRRMIDYGYDLYPKWLSNKNAANWAFMPVTPFLGKLLMPIFGDGKITLVIVSNLAFLISVPVFIMALKQMGISEKGQKHAIWLMCFSPFTVYSMAGYAEPLFIALVSGVFLCAYREQWLWAAILGLIAAITRNLGVMLVFSLLIIAIQHYGFRNLFTFRLPALRAVTATWVVPFGFFGFMTFLYFQSGDALAFGHIQIAWGRVFTHPIDWIEYGFERGGSKLYLTLVGLSGFAMVGYLCVKKYFAEAIFMFINLYLPFSSSLNAMPRYLFGLYPAFFCMVLLLERYPKARTPVLCSFAAFAPIITIGFFSRAFFTL
ncbi:conserved hypothetical protein [Vibrio nigripulchritudo SFn27]|uniref:Mannosyltransferase (PIG-V) n=1 Tax=Vibrio nigripulchritudo TaxID=28173 RepID=U4K617_9VIBR|nr:hypothetical protein [Vibrio nigripulchritudo]CCN82519.1 conserved hypothetical protein [Vibrio nigripulchritudo BLFn1]CCN87870.1 conserved hypothetical protein [Vibrio nigripulchritudo SFn27]CCN92066.1 conserved hypothetical protein [Vibrio nigripulchritudo ENn2]CCO43552.1 conserved hypothetical protein [Vibrio nigripulchritudo SFn135]CCO52867.1 conserved hypothetical protein [Vibrio nigripulchritudo Wn13]